MGFTSFAVNLFAKKPKRDWFCQNTKKLGPLNPRRIEIFRIENSVYIDEFLNLR